MTSTGDRQELCETLQDSNKNNGDRIVHMDCDIQRLLMRVIRELSTPLALINRAPYQRLSFFVELTP
jgi:hypothetical protein